MLQIGNSRQLSVTWGLCYIGLRATSPHNSFYYPNLINQRTLSRTKRKIYAAQLKRSYSKIVQNDIFVPNGTIIDPESPLISENNELKLNITELPSSEHNSSTHEPSKNNGMDFVPLTDNSMQNISFRGINLRKMSNNDDIMQKINLQLDTESDQNSDTIPIYKSSFEENDSTSNKPSAEIPEMNPENFNIHDLIQETIDARNDIRSTNSTDSSNRLDLLTKENDANKDNNEHETFKEETDPQKNEIHQSKFVILSERKKLLSNSNMGKIRHFANDKNYLTHSSISYTDLLETTNFKDTGTVKVKTDKDQNTDTTDELIVKLIEAYKPPVTENCLITEDLFTKIYDKIYQAFSTKDLKNYFTIVKYNKSSAGKSKKKLVDVLLKKIWLLKVNKNLKLKRKNIKDDKLQDNANVIDFNFSEVFLNSTSYKLILREIENKNELQYNFTDHVNKNEAWTTKLKSLLQLFKLKGNSLIIKTNPINESLIIWSVHDSMTQFVEIVIDALSNKVITSKWPTLETKNNDISGSFDQMEIDKLITNKLNIIIDHKRKKIFTLNAQVKNRALAFKNWALYQDIESKINNQFVAESSTEESSKAVNFEKKWYPICDKTSLQWFQDSKKWARLQNCFERESREGIINDNDKFLVNQMEMDKIYKFFEPKFDNSIENDEMRVFSVSMGQILQCLNTKEFLFQNRVPYLKEKISNLVVEQDFEKYLQIFLKAKNDDDLIKELWIGIDSITKNVITSIQCIIPKSRYNYLLQVPELPYDYKWSLDNVILQSINEEEQTKIRASFNNLPFDHENLNLPNRFEIDGKVFIPMHFNFQTIRKLKYMNKYDIQYSEIDGGPICNKYAQVDFICSQDKPTLTEFQQFVQDISQF